MPLNQWLSTEEFQQFADDKQQYSWLLETGSMTLKLTAAGNNPLVVKILSAEHQPIFEQERVLLNCHARRNAFVREVIMQVDEQPWMYGRTVIPDETLKGPGGQLKMLGSKPLGSLLFRNKKNLRVSVEIAKINHQHDLFPEFMSDIKKELWARRSLFLFEDSPLLVQEVFLPKCGL